MFREMIEGKFDGSEVVDGIDFEQHKIYFLSMQSEIQGAITRNDLSKSFLELL